MINGPSILMVASIPILALSSLQIEASQNLFKCSLEPRHLSLTAISSTIKFTKSKELARNSMSTRMGQFSPMIAN
jgi:hypothetical protein